MPGQTVVDVIVDFDDFHESCHELERLHELREANPKFRCTVFAVPGRGTDTFWESVPNWIELAVHGWMHPNPYECAQWTREEIEWVLDTDVVEYYFARGWKSPGWQTSDAIYQVLLERGWWIADHWDNDARRPAGLRTHVVTPNACVGTDPEHWHGHIPNVCGNGVEETFPRLLRFVEDASAFDLVSDRVHPWAGT